MLLLKRLLFFILFSITFIFLLIGYHRTSVSSSLDPLTIACSKDLAPFHFIDDRGQPAGIMIDTWLLWSEKTGIPITFQVADWNKTLSMVGSGEADIHAGLFFNEERDKYLDYGSPFLKMDTHYFQHTTIPRIKAISDLAPYRVGVIEGDFVEGYLKERLPAGNIVTFANYSAMMKALQEGTLKVFAADTLPGLYHLEKSELLSEFTFISEKPLYQNELFFAVQEGNQTLIENIAQGMAQITDEENRAIMRRWVSADDKENEALIVSINRSYAPLTFVNSLGHPSGLFVDMWREWAKKTGRKIQFRASSWAETLEGLRVGESDIHSGLSLSEERAEWLDFSTQLYETFSKIYHRSRDKQPKSIIEYGSNVVGTVFGSYQDAEFRKNYPDASIRNYGSSQELIDALLKGEVSAVVDEELSFETELDRLGLRGEIVSRPERLFSTTIHGAVLKGNGELVEQIDNGFAAIDSKRFEDIEKRWIPNAEDRFYDSETVSLNLSPEEKSWLAEHPIIRVAPDPDFVPIEFFDKQGQYSGLAAEFLNLAAERLGVKLEAIQTINWTHAFEALSSGEADLIGANIPVDEFKNDFIFTEPYFSLYDVIIAHDGKEHVHLEDLPGKEMLVVKGWPQVYYLKEHYPEIKIVEVENTLEGLFKIIHKEYDYFLTTFSSASYLIQEKGLTGIHVAGILAEANPAAVMVRKDSVILQNLLDKALASISRNERRDINRRWLPGLSELESKFTLPIELTKEQRLWLTDHPVIRVAMDPDWAPVEYADENGDYHGLSMDYLRQFSNTLGIQIEPVKGLSWQEAMEAMEKGEVDLLPSMARTPERESLYNFTSPYISMPINIFGGSDVTYIGNLDALNGKNVAVVNGYSIHEHLRRDYPEIKLLPAESVPTALKMLTTGEADAFVGNALVTSFYINKLQLTQIKVVGETPFKNDQSMAVRKDWPILAGILQTALEGIPQHEKDTIFNRWVSIKYEHGFDYSLLWKTGIPGTLAIFFLLYWNRRLGREIGERKRAEKQLLESENKIRAMSDASHDAVIMIDSQGEVMFWNTAAELLFGYPAEDAIGMNMHNIFAPEELRQSANAGLRRFQKSGKGPIVGNVVEQKALRYDGALIPVEIAVSSFKLDDEWYAVGLVRDITERKEGEEQVKKLSEAVEQSPVSVVITDKNAIIEYVNPTFTTVTGYTAEEVVGQNPSILKSDRTPKEIYADLWKTILGGTTWRGVFINRKKSGEEFWEDTTIAPIIDQEAEITHFVAIKEDITEKKKSEKELKEYVEDLEKFNRLTIRREERMIELKDEVNTLHERLGEGKLYTIR